jgi:hypothetical protein
MPPSLTPAQKARLVQLFSGKVARHGPLYSVTKYPAAAYQSYRQEFSSISSTAPVRDALLWKYGKAGRVSFPRAYNAVIADATKAWPAFVRTNSPEDTFMWWYSQLGNRSTRYITAAYLTHLIEHKRGVPIVDQHNFRAVNRLLRQVGAQLPTGSFWKAPSTWSDIETVGSVIEVISSGTGLAVGDVDRALMVYGAFLKRRIQRA